MRARLAGSPAPVSFQEHVTATELATAGRLVTALRPLFDED